MRELPDVQAYSTGFPPLAIEKVGMRHLQLPFYYRWPQDGQREKVLGVFESFCDLTSDHKGINMSRITRTIYSFFQDNKQGVSDFGSLAMALQKAHGSNFAQVKGAFSLPYLEQTPLSGLPSPEVLELELEATAQGQDVQHILTLRSTEMSLCPCSKEMSLLVNNISPQERKELDALSPALKEKVLEAGFGAHNQKSHVEVKVRMGEKGVLDPRVLLKLIKASVSSSTLTVLKRPDEKYETEMAYMGKALGLDGQWISGETGGPMFVEDIARSCAQALENLKQEDQILSYTVEVNNEESIHSNGILASALMGKL